MTVPRDPAHATHDPLVVAEAADRARTLPTELAACPDCVALHADLVRLATALPTSAVPSRPRDYTLTPADAARLRPGGWRRLVAAIGSSRDVVTRPLAIGFTTLGLAGLLVATVPGALPGGGSSGASVGAPEAPALEAPAAAPTSDPMTVSIPPESAGGDGATPTDDDVFSGEDAADPPASPVTGQTRAEASPGLVDEAAIRDDASGVSTLIVVAGAFLIAGLGLFGLRWSSRRFG